MRVIVRVSLVVSPAQDVARLALEYPTDGVERGEAHGASASVLQHSDVRRSDTDRVGKVTNRHPALHEEPIDVDANSHSHHLVKLNVPGDRTPQERPHH